MIQNVQDGSGLQATSTTPPFLKKSNIIKNAFIRSGNFHQVFGFNNMQLGWDDDAMKRTSKIKIDQFGYLSCTDNNIAGADTGNAHC